jgi:hypothetical protein
MKAILEMDLPESCSTCNQRHDALCGAAEFREIGLDEGARKRASFCPLKIVPDDNGMLVKDNRCPNCNAEAFYLLDDGNWYEFNYCDNCGQRLSWEGVE